MRYEIELTFVNNRLFILIISSFNFHRRRKKKEYAKYFCLKESMI